MSIQQKIRVDKGIIRAERYTISRVKERGVCVLKKYVWLFLLTAILSGSLFFGLRGIREEVATVTVRTLEQQTVTGVVSCTGKVEEAGREVIAASTGSRVQVRAAVPENRLRAVAVGQRVTVSGTAFSAERYSGTVLSIADKAYTTPSGTTVLDAVVALDATDTSLKCGLTAKVNICVSEQVGIVVPYRSLCADEEGKEYVFVAENGRAVKRVVTVAEELSDGVLITGGVAAGERLILHPETVTGDGMRVREAVE